MKKLVFVPLSDEMIYEHPELITGPIRAFSPAQTSSVEGNANTKSSRGAVRSALGTGNQRRPKVRPATGKVP
ncbi:MAG TPA: hypothetical protein DG761_02695 [Gammaproteobacteria bacterium]|jgi:hypothetical protein|nr:hypothetical protein [Acidiferrobacteraceae bacterium]MDP6552279.1 hypothetical protein [Arenicellales bacterium]MDP6790434.1 hypothetical protein [Arenicellales bacterium]MDP6919545.1 hypothetical protein [Arenicellales bacterium]HCX86911.1 hypothetical protein [Gammaproteobacteria bacterium]|tara:strand:- start:46010 stop:46225 length:216 start_codon:yes stop_codon:yes gene_type:complete